MRAVFLDRDGILNRAIVRDGKPYPPSSIAELEILEEAFSGCALLRQAGFKLICVTNQPDIARGTADMATIANFNQRIQAKLKLDSIGVCPHDDADQCHCRKPKPGLLLDAARDFEIDLSRSYMVGDRWRDIEAGEGAGCFTIFVDRGYTERKPDRADHITHSTLEASRWIVSHSQNLSERQ